MITIKKIDTIEGFKALENVWNNLLQKSEFDNFYSTFEWLYTWWENLGKKSELCILTIYDEEKLVGLVPFMSSNATLLKLPVKRIDFIGRGWGRGGIILDQNYQTDEVFKQLISFLRKNVKFGALVLSNISNKPESLSTFLGILRNNKFLYLARNNSSFYIPINISWEEYYENLPSELRNNLKGRMKACNKIGNVTFKNYSLPANLKMIMSDIFEISLKSWKGKEGTAIASNDNVKNFYLNLAEVLKAKNWLDISILEFNDEPISYFFCARYKKSLVHIDVAFDLEFSKFSPGTQLQIFVTKNLFEGKEFLECDLGMPMPYKKLYCPSERQTPDLYIFLRRPYSVFLFFLYAKVLPLLNFLKLRLKIQK